MNMEYKRDVVSKNGVCFVETPEDATCVFAVSNPDPRCGGRLKLPPACAARRCRGKGFYVKDVGGRQVLVACDEYKNKTTYLVESVLGDESERKWKLKEEKLLVDLNWFADFPGSYQYWSRYKVGDTLCVDGGCQHESKVVYRITKIEDGKIYGVLIKSEAVDIEKVYSGADVAVCH